MKAGVLIVLLAVAILFPAASPAFSGVEPGDLQAVLLRRIPPRPARAPSGSEFVKAILGLDKGRREEAIGRELAAGNIPEFLRNLKQVRFSRRSAGGGETALTLLAMPDYLAIGSDDDYLLIPMSLRTALDAAANYGFLLPTRRIVDAIFLQSPYHLKPQPLPAGPRMRSTAYYEEHNRRILQQRLSLCCPLGGLISGHKKDLVLTGRLERRPGQIAIYGWHDRSGNPIQPLSTVHGGAYADYSHGARLIADTALLDGRPRSVYEILEDPGLASLLSDEGPLAFVRRLMARHGALPGRGDQISRLRSEASGP